jgi:excisionase family DNA binding protein
MLFNAPGTVFFMRRDNVICKAAEIFRRDAEDAMEQQLASAIQFRRISMTPDEAAEATGFSRTRIFNAIKDGELTARKDGKATVVETTEIIRWVRAMPARGRAPDQASAAA